MDQGVIRSLKAYYRGKGVKRRQMPKISILQSLKILTDSWEVVNKETIINCFRKAGITPAVQQVAIADSDDPFKDLQESLNDLRKADSSMVPDDVTATALVSLDDDVIATAPEISEGGIIEISIEEIFDPVVEKPSRLAIATKMRPCLVTKARK